MTGGQRYWNEDAQRWEDAGGAGAGAGSGASVTPPPPPPSFQPVVPTSAPGGVTDPDAPAAGGWSVPEPPKPGASGAGRRRMVWGVLGGAAAVGVAVALVLSLVVGDDGGGGGADDRAGGPGTSAPQESPSPTPEGESEAVPTKTSTTGSPSADPSALPEGYELHQDAEGFTIARPTGWERETVPSQHGFDVVNYRSPDGFRRLQVYEIAESSPEESFELYLSEDTPKPDGFQQVEMVPLDAGVEGVRLEYLADSLRGEPEVGSWHVQDVRFRSPEDGKVYAVAAYGAPTDGVDPELELVLVAVEHFCPPSATCG
ncbi:hypothetical protein ACH4UX_32215 [Streptomyces althioticus]|uniref:Uncharacterized protein n=1 Tax=Streptomyces griseorubens TaxID=66897 RepID=A0ABR4SZ90_9ACTN|nr:MULTISPECIES: hypothetical protein [Actinomycetes]ALV51829.1 hypothetical protein ASR50_22070 [Streptomyces sp. 4F]KEG40408.1 hypothetical protein DJ64_09265 [Streptomyces griseorubens]WTC23489.1 hypothetical protein OG872_12750 [Streptomyces althioticus]